LQLFCDTRVHITSLPVKEAVLTCTKRTRLRQGDTNLTLQNLGAKAPYQAY